MQPGSVTAAPRSTHDAAVAAPVSHGKHDPISFRRLPPEILTLVLLEAAPSKWYSRLYYSALFDIREVCKQWMEIVDATPSLWTSIWLEFKLDLVSMILVKSKTQPLSIWYDDQTFAGYKQLPEDHISAFLGLVAPSSRRWEFLDYRASCYAPHGRLLGLPFDLLRQLNILLSANIKYPSKINAPRLVSLDVHRCSLNWHSVAGLRSLEIDQNTEGPDLSELITVLRASPNLEELKVERNWPMTATIDPESVHPLPPISLPNLHTMRFSKLPVVPLSILLDQIEAPNLLHFSHSMTYKSSSDDFPRIFGAAGRHIGGDTQFRKDGNLFQLTITASAETLGIKVGDREITLRRFRWSASDGYQEKVASLSAALARFHPRLCSAIRVVSLKGAPTNQEVAAYLRLLHQYCPELRELVVTGLEGNDTYVESIVETLSGEQDFNDQKQELFPRLSGLRLRAFSKGPMLCSSSILELVQGRAESKLVTPMKVLGLEGFRLARATAENLKRLVQEFRLTESEIVDVSDEPSLPSAGRSKLTIYL
ncbi:hypothetical protein FRC04_011382 [Tulasnella sp. 424]|nr:hypothetical protein FRC04_011382 [Tulasnella sp. 424]KAG8972613.1 hypothetical protein FRC05_009723 [Tulasnella sp. 425]